MRTTLCHRIKSK